MFCKEAPSEDAIRNLLSTLDPPHYRAKLADLDDPITEDEVASTIQACKPSKACGPDGLGNDFYRDHSTLLEPILTNIFNMWHEQGVFSASFLEADIFCLEKTGDLSNTLNYRSLALLNSDYKTFTIVLATRTGPKLSDMIHQNQAGFVPARQLHDTIDLFSAARTTVDTDQDQRDALTLLLDIEKAYDSLARLFLFSVLPWLGYPDRYLAVLKFLHTGTTIRFLVNELRSRLVQVTSGIRHGCPVAPLLFILAIEPLYRLIEALTGIAGVQLHTTYREIMLKVAGFADDTAAYWARHEKFRYCWG
ncbi:hypothetical protein PC128_g10704 [Phytophthora cactorum]|nr:hypothetical protein PC128_g10704 [Phytophthora cactorum]